METKDKLSTLNAKIESFIPGKLIVVSQYGDWVNGVYYVMSPSNVPFGGE